MPLIGRSLPKTAAQKTLGNISPEDVPNMTARHNENPPCAHPGLETELQVLPSPDVQAGVVAAQLEEEVAGDCEETSGHGWRGDRGGG